VSARKAWSVGGKIAVSALCLGFLGVRYANDPAARVALGRLELGAFALALALLVAGLVLSAVRWTILLRAGGANVGLPRTTHLYFVGYFFNTMLPTTVGGDVVRALALRDAAPLAVVGGSILLERLLGFACLLGLGIAASFALEGAAPARLPLAIAGALYAGALAALFLVRWPKGTPRSNEGRLRRAARSLARVAGETKTFGAHRKAIAAGIVLSFVWQVGLIVVNAVLSRGMGGVCPLSSLFVLVPVVQALAMIPISVGGLGVREVGYAEFFRIAGLDPAEGAALGFAWLAASSALALIGGAAFVLRPVSWRARVTS
jgi:uncharacterized protein (TIRG00374 family)